MSLLHTSFELTNWPISVEDEPMFPDFHPGNPLSPEVRVDGVERSTDSEVVNHLQQRHPNLLLADISLIVQNAVYHVFYLIALGLAVCEPFQYFGKHIYFLFSARKGLIAEE